MTTEKLKTQIAELLKVTDSEKNLAFLLFKKKISETLKLGEAIKIPNIGVFQLKEQFEVAENKLASSKGKTTIIFSPTEKNDDESLFLTLELDDQYSDSLEFDEKVFKIGIDKPILPIGDNVQKDDAELPLEKKISQMISQSEKIENFDLWDDYLDKQAASILPDETDELNDIDSYLQSEEVGPSEDDFMELDEDELLSEFENIEIDDDEITPSVEEEDTINEDEAANIKEAKEDQEELIIELEDKSIEPANEILEEIPIESDEIISNIDEVEEIDILDEEDNTHKIDESEFYEDKESNEKSKTIEETEHFVEEIQEENLTKEELKKENTEEVLPILEEDETIKNQSGKKMGLKKKSVMHERRYSPTIYALIAAFFIVGAIGIYYLFFNNPTWLYDQNEIEIELSEKHQKEFEEAKRKARLLAQKEDSIRIAKEKEKEGIVDNSDTTNNVKKKSANEGTKTIAKESNQEIINKAKTETKNAITIPKKEITNNQVKIVNKTKELPQKKVVVRKTSKMPKNVYFDGNSYSLQVSSWPKKYLAEKEVNRIKNIGYDAFIMKAYIPKYKKNWYRVRIKNLSSIEEAKKAQQEIK